MTIGLKVVPAAAWATTPFFGPEIFVLDEAQRLGTWGGSGYAPFAGPLTVSSQAAMLALGAVAGMSAYRSDTGEIYDCTNTSLSGSLSGWSVRASASAPVGTGTLAAIPLLKNVGASTTVAAAMEALSASMSKDGAYADVFTPEQGVIEIGAGMWDMERTLLIDLSSASTSRWGLTIRGQGRRSTVLRVPTTAAPANFKGGDNIWRAMRIRSQSGSGGIQHLRLENFMISSYATQGGDGSSTMTDAARWLDLESCVLAHLSGMMVYMRYPAALSKDQALYSLKSCYYTQMHDCAAAALGSADTSGVTVNGSTGKRRYGATGFRFENNNALTCIGSYMGNLNLGMHLIDEDGAFIQGGSIEGHNKVVLFEGDTSSCRVIGIRAEFNQFSNIAPVESTAETYAAQFGPKAYSNIAEFPFPPPFGAPADYDFSESRSNRVSYLGTAHRYQYAPANVMSAATWTNGSGMSHTAGSSVPSGIDPSISSSTEITTTGGYNQTRYSTAITVNPDLGSVWFRALAKRKSGMGMLGFELKCTTGGGSAVISRGKAYDATRQWNLQATVPVTSVTWAANKLTMVTTTPHGLQPGMRVQNTGAWGSLGSATSMYVESISGDYTAVLVAASGGTIADPGTVSTPGTITLPSDMQPYRFAPNVSAGWREMAVNVPIRQAISAQPSLDGSNRAVVTVPSTALNLATGAKIRLSGFADSRLNVDYTIQSGDMSGNAITLTTLGALAGLVTTATYTDGDGTGYYGMVGLTEVFAQWRTLTTNTSVNAVWEVCGETITQGPRY